MRECRFCHRPARVGSYSCGVCWASEGLADEDPDYEALLCPHDVDLNGWSCKVCDAALLDAIS